MPETKHLQQPDPTIPVHDRREAPTEVDTTNADEPLKSKIKITDDIEVWVRGHRGDIVDIVFRYTILYRDYLREDTDNLDRDDVKGNNEIITVRYGRERDLVAFYGLVYDDQQVLSHLDIMKWHVRDGKKYKISVKGGHVLIIYGNEYDLTTRFCYSQQGGWSRSAGNNRGRLDFPPCTESLGHTQKP